MPSRKGDRHTVSPWRGQDRVERMRSSERTSVSSSRVSMLSICTAGECTTIVFGRGRASSTTIRILERGSDRGRRRLGAARGGPRLSRRCPSRRRKAWPRMRAIVFTGVGQPLVEREIPHPEPGPGSVRLAVRACGVCRTDLHIVDGELPRPKLPLVLGHQIVGTVSALGAGVTRFAVGQRVGVPWLAWTCGAAATAAAAARTSATRRASPATTSTAALPRRRSPTSATASRFPRATRTCRRRRCSAPG